MTETAIRPEVVKLLASVDVTALGEHQALPEAFRELRHYDGRPVTSDEAAQVASATLAEFKESNRRGLAVAEALMAQAQDARRLADLAGRYWDGQADPTLGDALNAMTAAERAEADAILARLNNPQDAYLGQVRAALGELDDGA